MQINYGKIKDNLHITICFLLVSAWSCLRLSEVTYPYLPCGPRVDQPNRVWCVDISYLPMRGAFSIWWSSWTGIPAWPCHGGSRTRWDADFSRPGKPAGNVVIEAFNGRFRAECLNANWFLTLADATEKLEARCRYYNEE